MKFLKLLFVVFIFIIFIGKSYAQENIIQLTQEEEENLFEEEKPVLIKDVQALRVDFKQYIQNPKSKKVKFEMIIKSNIDSDRVKVTWNVSGKSIAADKSQQEQIFTVQKGGTYYSTFEVIPTAYGVSEVYGKAEAFGVAANTVATVRKNFASNDSGEILPLSDEYKSKRTQSLIITIVSYVLITIIIISIGYFILKKGIKWYERDDVKAYSERFNRS